MEDLEGGIETAMQAGVRKDHELSLGGFFSGDVFYHNFMFLFSHLVGINCFSNKSFMFFFKKVASWLNVDFIQVTNGLEWSVLLD